MKSLGFFALLALGGLMVPPLIHADVSDSGNLSIGGNGIIFGSMTVIGPIAGSSVTLSSSGAGAYDLTSSTGIHVLSGPIALESGAYIKWADGSTSTTAAGGGLGNAVLSATQTFTAPQTFAASITAGAAANFYHRVSSGAGTSASSFTIGSAALGGVLASTPSWHAEVALFQNSSAGIWTIQFNGDASSSYSYANVIDRSVSGMDPFQSGGATSCRLQGSNGATAGTAGNLHLWWTTTQDSPNHVHLSGFVVYDDASAPGSGGALSCNYAGSAPPTSITIATSAGTINYRYRVEREDW